MEVCFAVPWIESEAGWGQKPEGYKLFLDRDACIRETKKASNLFNKKDSKYYFGPVRPLVYYEVPMVCLPEAEVGRLKEKGECFTGAAWEPKFKSQAYSI